MTHDVPHDPLANPAWKHPEPSARVAEVIRRQCTTDLAPVKRMRPGRRAVVAGAASAVVIIAVTLLRRNVDRPDGVLRAALLGALGWAVVQGFVLVVGLVTPPGRRVQRSLRIALLTLIPVAFCVYLALDSTRVFTLDHLLHTEGIMRCTLYSLLFGGIVAATVLALWRRTDPFDPGLSGALAGLVGGLTGAVTVGVACPNVEAWHLCIGHMLGLVLLGAIGWLVGRRWLAP